MNSNDKSIRFYNGGSYLIQTGTKLGNSLISKKEAGGLFKNSQKYYGGTILEGQSGGFVDQFGKPISFVFDSVDLKINPIKVQGTVKEVNNSKRKRWFNRFLSSNKANYDISTSTQNLTKSSMRPTLMDYLMSISKIVPKSCREEAMADLIANQDDLKKDGYGKIWQFCFLSFQLATVFYYMYKLKLKDYLNPEPINEISED